MTYHSTAAAALESAPFASEDRCFCCNARLEGPTVTYDAYPHPDGTLKSVNMHRDCAFAMAQRMICDTWPHRLDSADLRIKGV